MRREAAIQPSVFIILAASAIGSACAAVKLRLSGLSSRYRRFFEYMIFRSVYIALMLCLDPKSKTYFYSYLLAQPIAWFYYVAVALELSKLVLERHKGFYWVGRWAMGAGVVISMLVSVVALIIKIAPQEPQVSLFAIGLAVGVERGLDFGLGIFLILMLFLLNWYTVPLSRNIAVHAPIYVLFFLSGALGTILRTFFGLSLLAVTDAISLAGPCLCVWAWFFLLTPEGEEARVKVPWFAPAQEARILHQLDALNATLLKVAQK